MSDDTVDEERVMALSVGPGALQSAIAALGESEGGIPLELDSEVLLQRMAEVQSENYRQGLTIVDLTRRLERRPYEVIRNQNLITENEHLRELVLYLAHSYTAHDPSDWHYGTKQAADLLRNYDDRVDLADLLLDVTDLDVEDD
jgi:hypothetical protein